MYFSILHCLPALYHSLGESEHVFHLSLEKEMRPHVITEADLQQTLSERL